jgi:hypothetical protein
VAFAVGLAGCGSAGTATAPTTEITLPTVPAQPEITVDSQASACSAWALIWPTVDRASISGNIDPVSTLIATGGPQQALFALTDWAAGQLSSANPSPFSDDVNVALKQLTGLSPGGGTGPLRTASLVVNADCV